MHAQGISLRPIDASDDAFLIQVYTSTREAELALVPWTDEQKRQFVRMQFDAQHRYYHEQFTGASFDLILADGHRAGRLYVDRTSAELRIIDIALLPEHRGHGVGTHLIARLQEEAATRGLPLRIRVERFNPALRLYQRLGFTLVGDGDVYRLMEWRAHGPA